MILNDAQVTQVRALQRQFKPFANKGWMCEGSEYGNTPCNAIFNNTSDEFFLAAYDGTILSSRVTSEPIENIRRMADIQGKIRLVCQQ